VAELAPEGLRWLAILEKDGTVRVQGGEPVGEVSAAELMAARPFVPVEVGDHARAVFRRFGRRGGEGKARDRGWRLRSESGSFGAGALVIEFEPTAARELRATARRTLGL